MREVGVANAVLLIHLAIAIVLSSSLHVNFWLVTVETMGLLVLIENWGKGGIWL